MAGTQHGLTRLDQLMKSCIHGNGPARPFAQVLGRVMPPNPVQISNITHADVIAALDELSQGMGVDENTDGPADAGMTFFGVVSQISQRVENVPWAGHMTATRKDHGVKKNLAKQGPSTHGNTIQASKLEPYLSRQAIRPRTGQITIEP